MADNSNMPVVVTTRDMEYDDPWNGYRSYLGQGTMFWLAGQSSYPDGVRLTENPDGSRPFLFPADAIEEVG